MKRPCSVESCIKEAESLGYCPSHYHRFRKYGDPLKGYPGPKATAIEAFNYYVSVSYDEDACWGWIGACMGSGPRKYGVFMAETVRYSAHRFSYTYHHGKIPDGYFVCHKCDNPPCCNPKHLFVGTAEDNSRDMSTKERSGNMLLTLQQVKDIRATYTGRKGEQVELAKKYKVNYRTISAILNGTSWKCATSDTGNKVLEDKLVGSKTCLTRSQAIEIKARYTGKHGEQSDLAKEYGVSNLVISRLLRGITWKDLET